MDLKGGKKLDKEGNKLLLFGQIVLVGFVSLFIHASIMTQVCTNCGFFTIAICLLGWLPALCVGFVIFVLIIRSKYRKFVTLKSSTIFSLILAFVIIIHGVSYYYMTVPPNEVTNSWECDKDQDISEVLKSMGIYYGITYTFKSGNFYKVANATQGTNFDWEYDESTKVITMTENRNEDWELQLKLYIKLTESHYNMTTYYVSDDNFNLFNPLLFDNTTWKGLIWYSPQGREGIPDFESVVILIVFVFFISGYMILTRKNKK